MNLPQAQEENEGDDESAYRYAVSQIIDDESDLVMHWILSLKKAEHKGHYWVEHFYWALLTEHLAR